jgi:hypothetical protein
MIFVGTTVYSAIYHRAFGILIDSCVPFKISNDDNNQN